MAYRTNEDLMESKVYAVKKALKEAKVYIPKYCLDAVIEAMNPTKRYEIEVVRDAERARKLLTLTHCDTSGHGMMTAITEEGQVLFGRVKFGRNDYSDSYDDEEESIGPPDRYEYPAFDSRSYFGVLIETCRANWHHDVIRNTSAMIYRIVVYAPSPKLSSRRITSRM